MRSLSGKSGKQPGQSQSVAKKGLRFILGTTEPSRKAFDEYSNQVLAPVNNRRKETKAAPKKSISSFGVDGTDDGKSFDEKEKEELAAILTTGASSGPLTRSDKRITTDPALDKDDAPAPATNEDGDPTPVPGTPSASPPSPSIPFWMEGSPERFVEPAMPFSKERKRGGMYGSTAFEALSIGSLAARAEERGEEPAMAMEEVVEGREESIIAREGGEDGEEREERREEEEEEKKVGCWGALGGCFRK